ncbi:hypothetical protein [Anaerovorax sp. IOR16]|uniref:hypothetical protein n=1 Tax=Anaerovorax sp. IOR16 TaxID=2773458 RepID=UPI001FD68483|nr:hypothetical protein [Anaerovorax sp. IOR16]
MDAYEAIEKLQGISYRDWVKVKTSVDRAFEMKKRELENDIQLTDKEKVKELIRSQFG